MVMCPRGGLFKEESVRVLWGDCAPCYFLRAIRRPGSEELTETRFPFTSRVVSKPFVGATSDSVAFVSHDGRRVAEASGDRADDFTVPVTNVVLLQHVLTCLHLKYT